MIEVIFGAANSTFAFSYPAAHGHWQCQQDARKLSDEKSRDWTRNKEREPSTEENFYQNNQKHVSIVTQRSTLLMKYG